MANSYFSKLLKMAKSVLALSLLVGSGTFATAQTFKRGTPFKSIEYYGYSGKVGHHMTIYPSLLNTLSPDGNGCSWTFSDAALGSSQIPPGLEFNSSTARLEGTPRQPGRWTVTVFFYDVH